MSKRTGKFSHCAMSAGYKSGSRLVFAILRDKTMSIGVTHPKWQMNVGSQLPLDFSVDGRHAVTAKAKVINPRQYASYFKSKAEIFEMIRNGRVLQISSSGSTQKFSLTGINQSLVKLLACTVNALKAENAAAASAPANPFSGSSSPPPANPFSGSGASAAPSNPFTSPAARRPAKPAPRKPLFGKERDA
ncbi:MAG: hypothetical protein C0605_00790 [Hyphomicrobiales bacterium]|nr:MAG: hypothetical protein C0605_00790 [Hyphomicrobiales bacterium]